MTIRCADGIITDGEIASWDRALPPVGVPLTCDEVRALFVGKPLARGIALLRLNRVQWAKLFPEPAKRKAAYHLARFASRITSARARELLANASWHQLRAAAAHEGEDAQITAVMRWILGAR